MRVAYLEDIAHKREFYKMDQWTFGVTTMRQIAKTVYLFSELPTERAKEKARDWLRTCIAQDFDPDYIRDEFVTLLHACGFDVDSQRGRPNGKAIYWNLNPTEASFDASWSAARLNGKTCADACAAILVDRPQDSETHRIVKALQAFAAKYPDSSAGCSSGRDGTSQSVDFDCGGDDTDGDANVFEELVTDLAFEFAKSVSADAEYQNSDEAIDESMEANGYEFDESGDIV